MVRRKVKQAMIKYERSAIRCWNRTMIAHGWYDRVIVRNGFLYTDWDFD
jgi:hypothetical protein